MARTPEEVLRDLVGNLVMQVASLTSALEIMKEAKVVEKKTEEEK